MSIELCPRLNLPQARFLAMPFKYKSYVAGFGAGKTWAGCAGTAKHLYEFPRVNAGYFAPTYPQIRDIFYPTIEEVFFDWGLRAKVHVGNHEVHAYRGARFMGTILCRSMDTPGSIVGFKIGHAMVDEIDTMTADKARDAWRKIIARMRYKIDGLRNGIDVTTTPEGFRFVYQQFSKAPRETPSLAAMYGIIHASTHDNAINLPADYIPSLLASYPPQLIDAYINGQFVNLQTGSVYSAYNRELNDCRDTIQPGEILYVGMDFNVGKMAAITHVKRDGLPRAVDEIVGGYDTPDMIRKIKERYWRHDGRDYVSTRQIRVYPDASGDSRKSVNASTTDIAMLRNAGFGVFAPGSNPPVKDRINSMNAMFCNAEGARRYLVNAEKCPTYAEALQQQAWAANGEPDKTSGHDHYCFTGETKVETDGGIFEIKDIPERGLIRTPDGNLSPYFHAGIKGKNKAVVRVVFDDGAFVVCTPEHLFLTENGWVKAVDLCNTTCYKWLYYHGGEKWSRFCQKNSKSLMAKFTGFAASIFSGLASVFTAPCMSFTTDQSQRGPLSTMLTETGTTTTSKTWCLWGAVNTFACTCMSRTGRQIPVVLSGVPSRPLPSGTGPKRAANGTENIISKQKTNFGRSVNSFAQCVARFMKLRTLAETSFARKSACQLGAESPGLTMRTRYAQLAERYFKRTNTSRSSIAPRNAGPQASGAKVVAVIPQPMAESVYCLTVPNHGCFALACGVVVSNCDAAGYLINYEYPINARRTSSVNISMR